MQTLPRRAMSAIWNAAGRYCSYAEDCTLRSGMLSQRSSSAGFITKCLITHHRFDFLFVETSDTVCTYRSWFENKSFCTTSEMIFRRIMCKSNPEEDLDLTSIERKHLKRITRGERPQKFGCTRKSPTTRNALITRNRTADLCFAFARVCTLSPNSFLGIIIQKHAISQ